MNSSSDRSNMGATASQSPDNPVPLDLGADRPASVDSMLTSQVRNNRPQLTSG